MMTNDAIKAISELDLEPIKMKLMHVESGEGWSLEKAEAVEVEYRRFLCLMKAFPEEDISPLAEVDIFWHYHILDTMKYAKDCEQAFGYFLHHYPYVGMSGAHDDAQVLQACADRMRDLYEQVFDESYGQRASAWCAKAAPAALASAWCAKAAPAALASAWCAKAAPATLASAWCAKAAPAALASAWCAKAAPAAPASAWCAKAAPAALASAWCAKAAPAVPAPASAWCAKAAPAALRSAWCVKTTPSGASAASSARAEPPAAAEPMLVSAATAALIQSISHGDLQPA
ncbi:glycine-rich domain-containing protein [Massilia antarctica]|uniref:glycine-rich domain-containing protein n=1 Tax=Massilia antarctica TaxID=2765360 RepID=UPI0006BD762E|nr:hypothetical protein [Massilia sp. H27-R4]MCY0916185.1 hypothetical protein [Massilia sp. H27-R4]CUI07992.1 Light-harvesting LHII, alpha subunit B / Histone protein [Janthinobacterium sp. CG23_2]CUU31778.1 Light-harvesting LHII, alpha subunit B / Histone protein [Janthinobacterium sp. CG23_2]